MAAARDTRKGLSSGRQFVACRKTPRAKRASPGGKAAGPRAEGAPSYFLGVFAVAVFEKLE